MIQLRTWMRRLLMSGAALLSAGFGQAAVTSYTGPVNPLPANVGTVGFGQTGQPNDASLARGTGKTYTFTPTNIPNTSKVYWGPSPSGIAESFYRNPPQGTEIFAFSGQPQPNVGVWTGQTLSPVNFQTVYLRFTLTVRDGGGLPVTLISASTLGLPTSVGLVAPVNQGGTFTSQFLFEASWAPNGSWMPALEFFDAIPNKSPALGGTAQTSFSSGYYYNLAPTIAPPADALTNRNTATAPLTFSITDEAVSSVTVTGASSNPAVIANSGILVAGNGASRTVTVTPVTDAYGAATITLTANDGLLSSTSTFNVTVNQPPRLNVNTPLAAIQGASAILTPANLRASDTVSGESQITFTIAPGGTGGAPSFGVLEKIGVGTIPAGGSFTMADVTAGQIRYVNDGTVSPGDGFQFGVTDHQGGVAYDVTFTTFTFNVQITLVNQPPKAVAASYNLGMGATLNKTLGATDVDSTEFTFAVSTPPVHGSVTSLNAITGEFTYESEAGFNGTDTFEYIVNDGEYNSTPKTITIVVANQAPSVENLTISLLEGATHSGQVVVSDPDLPAQTLVFEVTTPPARGQVEFSGNNGAFTYTSTTGLFGADSFTFTVSDGVSAPVASTATIAVRPILSAGRLLVADSNGRQIVLIDQTTGAEFSVSKDGLITHPASLVVTKAGQIIVLDESGIVRVNPLTGAQTAIVAASALPAAPNLSRNGMAQEADGMLLIANGDAGIVRLDPSTGIVTSLTTDPLLAVGVGIGLNGEIYATHVGAFVGGESSIVRVDPTTGALTTIATGGNIVLPSSVQVEADGNLLVSNVLSFMGGEDNIVRVNPSTGAQTLLTSGNSLDGTFQIGLGADGKIFAPVEDARRIVQIDQVSGVQSTVTQATGVFQGSHAVVVLNAPVISAITAQETNQNFALQDLPFTVWNPQLASAFVDVTFSSDNQALIPNANIVATGTGGARLLTVTPATNKYGTANITITGTNGLFTSTRVFELTVHHVNQVPVAAADNGGSVVFAQSIDIDVLANDTDVEEDVLTLESATGATLGTVEVVNGKVRYTAGLIAGVDAFSYTIKDVTGQTSVGSVTLNVVEPSADISILLSKAGAVPGAGTVAGIPASSTWTSFGSPAVNDHGELAVIGSSRSPGATSRAICKFTSDGTGVKVLARVGQGVPGITGATFGSFRDPLIAGDGSVLFLATIKGENITAANRAILVWGSPDGASIEVVARVGSAIDALNGASLKSISAIALQSGRKAAFRGTLNSGGTVSTVNDLVVLSWLGADLKLAVRENSALGSLGVVKRIATLVGGTAAPGAGRGWLIGDEAGAVVGARITTADGVHRYVQIDAETGAPVEIVNTAAASIGLPAAPAGLKFKTLGVPSFSAGSETSASFYGSLNTFSAILDLDRETGTSRVVQRIGGPAIGFAGATIRSLKDPVLSADGSQKVWDSLIKGANVLTNNDRVLYWTTDDSLPEVLAREGARPPGCPEGSQWKSFSSIAAVGGECGPIFTGSMVAFTRVGTVKGPGPGGVTSATDVGLWGVDSLGGLRLLLREGQQIGTFTVRSFNVLKAASGSTGSSRSFNGNGEVVASVTSTTGTTHIIRLAIP